MKTQNMNKNQIDLEDRVDNHKHKSPIILFCKEALVGLGVLWLCVIGLFVQLYGVVVVVLIFNWVSSVWALVVVGCVATAEVEEDWESQLVFSREVKRKGF